MKLPQLSLRDLFWLVALVAMGCGWWVDRAGINRELDQLRQQDRLFKMNAFDGPPMPAPIR